MTFRRLILTLLAAICLLLPTKVTAAVEEARAEAGIYGTDNRPQWQDVGMRDVLAVTGGSTLTPPSMVRVAHDGPTSIAPSAQAAQARHYTIRRLSAKSHHHIVNGYIYLIRCLRL